MTIPFKQIPGNLRLPLFFAEVDNSQANTAQATQRALIIGQATSSGSGIPNVPVISQGVADAKAIGGANSILARMTYAYRLNDTFGELWYLPLADDPSATGASGSIAFTAAATASGTLYLYVAGLRYTLPVLSTQSVAQVATALSALLNGDPKCPVLATASAGTVTLAAYNKGVAGNDIDIRVNYLGAQGGEVAPAGLAWTITAMSGGAVNPSLTAGLAALGSQTFDYIVCPYTDATSLNALSTFLNDSVGRWAWSQQIYGHVFTAARGALGSLVSLGNGRNDQHATILGFYDSPTPNYVWAAALAAQAAVSGRADPGQPLQTLALAGVLAPPIQSRFVMTDRNTLLYDGISTFTVGDDGTVALENVITTYQKNQFGSPDNSYLEVETMLTLTYVLRYMRAAVTSKFSRSKLAANGTRFGANSGNVVTPNIIRGELIAQYAALEEQGLVQNADAFAAGLIVEQNATNPNRVDVLWPGTLIDQLRIFAVLAQFRLQ